MKWTVFTLVPLFGLCLLSVWGNRAYRPVIKQLPWAEAQSYCRATYLDLATVDNEEQLGQLVKATASYGPSLGKMWIGLYDDVNSWRWSLQEEGYYDGGRDQFRMWASGEPNNYANSECCAVMLHDGTWKDSSCSPTRPFFCYRGTSPHFIHVSAYKTWTGAQSYCRRYYTDLASVRNQTENNQLKAMLQVFTWIGLYRDSWKWSDGSLVQITKWDDGRPTGLPCVALYKGSLVDEDCSTPNYFVCNDYQFRLVVKLEVKTKWSLKEEDVAEVMLEQFRMKMNGLDGNIKLTWRRQPDRKVFHLKKGN